MSIKIDERFKRECIQCGETFYLNPRTGIKWAEKTGRGKYCSSKCRTDYSKGVHKSPSTEFKKGMKPEEHPRWKGGRTANYAGYIHVHNPGQPNADHHGYVMEHRLVMEAHLKRILSPEEVVHHINKDVSDNRLENLELFENHSEHQKHHHPKGYKFGSEPSCLR